MSGFYWHLDSLLARQIIQMMVTSVLSLLRENLVCRNISGSFPGQELARFSSPVVCGTGYAYTSTACCSKQADRLDTQGKSPEKAEIDRLQGLKYY